MTAFHLHARRRRALSAMGLVAMALALLVLAFFHTQVLRSPTYAMQSDRNRLRPLMLPAPRGMVLDRHGRVVADNVPGYALSILPAPEPAVRRVLERLMPHVSLDTADVAALLQRRRRYPQQPLVVSPDLPFEAVAAIEERRQAFPEVMLEMQPRRRYPGGAAAGHLIGYVGEIGEHELRDTVFASYAPGRLVGKSGVERQYERRLAGRPGVRYIEVDALGRMVDDYAHPGAMVPAAGRAVQLSIDLALQRWIARLLPDTVRGAVAALEPATGAVLALYSAPSVDPNEFVGGVSRERWRELIQDPSHRLLDRSVAGLYPPASTWKPATAAIALELGIVEPEATMPLACRGGMQYGNRYFRCWDRSGHGALDLADALKHSCDVYFYQLGLQIGLDRLLQEGVRLGFARGTGVDLPGERAGVFLADRTAWRRRFGRAPVESEVLSLAIGQGPNDQTVLKMAQFYAALATDGRAPAPSVGPADGAGRPMLDLRLSRSTLDHLREGLRRVVEPGGTAHGSALEHWDWLGKTGTAENPHGADHGWFVGYAGARGGAPEIVVAVIIEGGERGSDVAQYAAKAADYYLRRKHGMQTDTIQTLREHWAAGRPAGWAAWE